MRGHINRYARSLYFVHKRFYEEHLRPEFYISKWPKALKVKPIINMPVVTMPTKVRSRGVLTTFFNNTIDGSERAVTAIIKAKAVPMPTPLITSASAIGNVPKISAYMGTPTRVARGTEYHLS